MESQIAERRDWRAKRVRLALAASLPSKVASVLVQLVAFPVALRALGPETFGVYAVVSSSLTWLSLSSIGVGPALTRIVAQTVDEQGLALKRFVGSALAITLAVVGFIAVVAALGIWISPVSVLFGEKYVPFAASIKSGLFTALALLFVQISLSPIDALQAGLQQQYIINARGAVANVVSLLSIFAVAKFAPSVPALLLATMAPTVFAQLINAFYVMWIDRPQMRNCLAHANWIDARRLAGTGVAFSAVQLSVLLCADVCVLIVGRFNGPVPAGTFAVMLQVIILAMGVVNVVTVPMWPSFADATARQDHDWALLAFRKLRMFSLVYSVAFGVLFGLLADHLMPILFGNRFHAVPWLTIATGLYLGCLAWEHIHYMALIGVGSVKAASRVMLARSLVALPMALVVVAPLGPAAVMFSLSAAIILVSGWLLPRQVSSAFIVNTVAYQ